MPRERLARFEREAKTLATLNHPNVAQIYGILTFRPRPETTRPNSAVPFTFSGMPSPRHRLSQELEISWRLQGHVRWYRQRRRLIPERAELQATPADRVRDFAFSVVRLASGTPNVCAAAVTSIVRAVAPDSRSSFHMPRTLLFVRPEFRKVSL